MKKGVLIGLGAAGGLAALAACGYGAWYAWDNGLIPGNPRAPTLAIMQPIVERSAQAQYLMQPAPCIGPDIGRLNPEVQGRPGVASRPYPGQHSVSFLIEGAAQTQDVRDRVLQQYSFLAKQGLFSEAEVTLQTDAGARAAKEFSLTWKGFAALGQEYGGACFAAGRREFVMMESMAKAPEAALGMDLWEVSYRSTVEDVPAWSQTPEAKALFPRYAEASAPRTEKARLLRGKEGWLTEQEMQIQLQLAQLRSAGQDVNLLAAQLGRATVPPRASLEGAAVQKLFDEYLASAEWQQRSMAACLPLALQRGGDERATAGFDRTSFAATWYDAPAPVRPDHARNTMLAQLHILSALEAAGLVTMAKAPRGTLNGQPVAGGITFTAKPEALESLGLAGGNCMAVGRIGKIELLGFRATGAGGGVRIAARGEVILVQPWARALAERLPALKQVLDEGLPFTGQLQFGAGYEPAGAMGQPKWRVVALAPAYPQIAYDAVPAPLQPFFPATTQSATKLVKAPLLLPGLPVLAPPAAAPAAAPAPSMQPGSPAPAPQVAAPAPQAAAAPQPARRIPYPAGAADVHVVSVYEGQLPGGAKRGFQQHPEGRADVVVGKTAGPVFLLLSSYEPVEWRVKVEGAKLQRVIALGNHDQRVTVTGARGVQVLTQKAHDFFAAAGIELREGFPREGRGNKAIEAAEIVLALTGKLPASFQAAYTAGKVFVVDASSPPLVLPEAKSAASQGAGKVVLTSPWKQAIGELTVQYGGAGAYTEAWASRAYSQGKVYFEATLQVEGGGAAQPHANVGIAELGPRGGITHSMDAQTPTIPHGEQKIYNHGDVFGLAVDYDGGMMYARVNGQWITGEPGSRTGRRFRTGRERAAYLYATGGNGGDKRGSVSWQANFGASPFRYPLPASYVSYDGSQR